MPDITWHILLVDDDEDDYLLTREMLAAARRGKFQIKWVSTYHAGRTALLNQQFDAALVDYDMGARSGIDLIREVTAAGCATPIILFTGRGTYEVDVEAMQAGAMDYLSKGETNPALLERAIRYAMERRRHENELAAANEALSAANAQLAARRQELMEMLGSIRDGFFSLDREWRFVYVNTVAAQRGGQEPTQLIGKMIWEVYPRLVGTTAWDRYHEVMESRVPAYFEMEGVGEQKRYYEVRVYPSANGISVFSIDVTEQKTVKDALDRERELLQKIFDNIPVMINVYHPGNPLPQINAFFTQSTGWTAADIAGTNLMELCYPDPTYRAEIMERMESKAPGWHDCNVTTRSGEILITSWTNLRLSDGTHLGIGIDISERKQAEEMMRAQQQWMAERIRQFEDAFENAPAGMVVFEPEAPFRILSYNRQFQQYLPEPFREDSLLGTALGDYFDEVNNPDLLGIFEEVLASGKTVVLQQAPYDGLPRGRTWWSCSIAPVRSGDQITGLAILLVESTEEVKTRLVLEQERAFLNTVLEQLPLAVIIFDAQDSRVMLANRQVKKMLRIQAPGEDRQEMYAALTRFFTSGRDLPAGEWPFARALREGTATRDAEVAVVRGDGTQGVVTISASPIYGPHGEILAAVAVFQDVTERKRADRDTTFLVNLGEQLNQPRNAGQMLTSISQQVVEHLDANRCMFFEVDPTGAFGTLPEMAQWQSTGLPASYPLENLPEDILTEHAAGRAVLNRDAKNDARTAHLYRKAGWPEGMRSYVSVPLMRGGRWVAAMVIGDSRPRKWNDRQVAFLQSVAERTWAAFETRRLMDALVDNQERYRMLAEDAQLNSQKLEAIIENLNEAVFISDLNGRFTRVNSAGLALHGFTRQDEMLLDLNLLFELVEGYTPDGRRLLNHERPVARAARGETVLNYEMHGRRKDTGKEWIGLYTSLPVRGDDGEVLFILSTVVDITHLRESELQRSAMRAALQTQHLLVAQREEERIQIARDIHDGPLQDLIALTYALQSVMQDHNQPGSQQIIENLRAQSQKLVNDLRGVCNELRPPLLARFGLARSIQAHAEELQEHQTALTLQLDLEEDHEQLPMDVRLAFYRIYQESVRNIQRHSGATECRVRLRVRPESVVLEVEDNGSGFELPGDWLTLARQGHLGLVGIKERAEAVGGRLEIKSQPGAGTLVRVVLER